MIRPGGGISTEIGCQSGGKRCREKKQKKEHSTLLTSRRREKGQCGCLGYRESNEKEIRSRKKKGSSGKKEGENRGTSSGVPRNRRRKWMSNEKIKEGMYGGLGGLELTRNTPFTNPRKKKPWTVLSKNLQRGLRPEGRKERKVTKMWGVLSSGALDCVRYRKEEILG